MKRVPDQAIAHLRRHDFSAWVDGVFGDGSLSARLIEIESRYTLEPYPGVGSEIGSLIRERYGLPVLSVSG